LTACWIDGFINAISPAKEADVHSELPTIRDADRVVVYLKQMVFQMKLLVNRVRSDMIQKK
jgi:septum formation inhibitor-activating ATPase MinD